MGNNKRAMIADAASTAKLNFEILHKNGIFPTEGELFIAKHRLIKAIKAIMSLSKPEKRGRRG